MRGRFCLSFHERITVTSLTEFTSVNVTDIHNGISHSICETFTWVIILKLGHFTMLRSSSSILQPHRLRHTWESENYINSHSVGILTTSPVNREFHNQVLWQALSHEFKMFPQFNITPVALKGFHIPQVTSSVEIRILRCYPRNYTRCWF
jgi:hypothetical protein